MEGGEEEDYPELLSDFEPSNPPKKSDFKRRLPTSLQTLPPNTAKLLYCGCGYLCHLDLQSDWDRLKVLKHSIRIELMKTQNHDHETMLMMIFDEALMR